MSYNNILIFISLALISPGCQSIPQKNLPSGNQEPSLPPQITEVHTPMGKPTPTPTPQPHFSIEAPSGLKVNVGQTLQLREKLVPETLQGNEAISWNVDEKFREYAAIDATGLVKALRAGSVPLYLNVDARRAKVLLAITEPGLFAQQIQLPPEVSNEAPQGAELSVAKILNTQLEWERFWKENMKTYYRGVPITPLPPAPTVEFSTKSIIAWFDIKDNNERSPIVTTINDHEGAINIAFPNVVAYPYNITTTGLPTIFLFMTDKLSSDSKVHIHHLRE